MLSIPKRSLSLAIITVWVLLFGVSLAEQYGWCDSEECDTQAFEQLLTTPYENPVSSFNQLSPGESKLQFFKIPDTFSPFTSTHYSPGELLKYQDRFLEFSGSPPLSGDLKLFQLLLNFRL
jgi:hypothetical protein